MQLIPIGVIAKNEAQAIGTCLTSLLADVAHTEKVLDVRFDVVAVLDDCTDGTESVVRQFDRVRIIQSTGGVIEAQRCLANSAPFVIYADADILIEQGTLAALVQTMLDEPARQVAYPCKSPLKPRKATWLARALHTYNRVNGFQTPRRYFNGRLFAIRDWQVPTLAALKPRLETLKADKFYNFHAGMRVDDIYLSRDIIARYGPDAVREVSDGMIYYQPPETFEGMYRTYRRMRMEIERLDILFPDLRSVHRTHGIRRYDRDAIRKAPWNDVADWYLFRLALGICIIRYRTERIYYQYVSHSMCPAWEPIVESKCLPLIPPSVL